MRKIISVLIILFAFIVLSGVVYLAIKANEIGLFDAWPTWLSCIVALAIFVAFYVFSFLTSLKKKPRNPHEWKLALIRFIEGVIGRYGKDDPFRFQ